MTGYALDVWDATRDKGRAGGVFRSFIDQLDLEPCYAVTDGGTCWVVRCKRCSAGWLPSKTSNAGLTPLLFHAKRRHKVKLRRRWPLMLSIGPDAARTSGAYISGMPIQIPADAKTIQEQRLTMIRVVGTLNDKLVEGDDGLKARVKATMRDKGAAFAESDLVVGALRAGTARGTITPQALYALVESGTLTLPQFFECVTVTKKPLERFLGKDAIEAMTKPGPAPEPSLVTEFKAGLEFDPDQLAELLAGSLSRVVPIRAA